MTRVDELQKKYPGVPRQTLVKAEALTRGVRDTDELYKHSYWHRMGGSGTYQTYDHDVSLRDAEEKRNAGAKAGYVRRLEDFYLKGGWRIMPHRDSTSPYEIRETAPGRYAICEGEEKVEEIYFAPDKLPWPYLTREEPLTSSGKPVTTVAALRSPTCSRVVPVRHCEYFSTGEQCKFCNFNATQDDARSVGGMIPITSRLEEMAEAYKILTSDTRIIDTCIVGGAFTKIDKEVNMYFDLVEKIASAASYKHNISLVAQPPASRRDIQRLKDSGLDMISFDIEVWDAELFPQICPGKARYVGRDRYLEAWLEAVDIFGPGYVVGVLVPGATLLHANGPKTWQESRDVLIEGIQWLTENGVVPCQPTLHWAPGSEFSKDPASRNRIPPVEHHLDLMLAQHAAMKEHGLYETMTRFAMCTQCCNENQFPMDLGIYEATGGDVSKWLAPLIPDEANWLARVVESIEESGSVKETPVASTARNE